MKERPILFSAPMVRAILAGTKTQTRRVVKVQPPGDGYELATCLSTSGNKRDEGRHHWILRDGYNVVDGGQQYFACPYGYPGDGLWVREAWRVESTLNDIPPRDVSRCATLWWEADNNHRPTSMLHPGKLRPSMFMPRWASRILLEIVNVRVERLQDISEEDALAEGVTVTPCKPSRAERMGRDAYASLWEDLNGNTPAEWAANPWVWVVEFKRAGGEA